MSTWLFVALTSLAIGLVLQPILIPWLRRQGLLDVPNHRSSHAVDTPRGGGIAVLAAVGLSVIVARGSSQAWTVFAGCCVLGAMGLADDFRGIDAKVRLAAIVLVGAGAGLFLGSRLPWLVAVPAMALWTAAYVNAFNFMDGINGIAALNGIVAGGAFAAMGGAYRSPALVGLGAALLGGCLSFLPFNLPSAKVFMGDVGSYGVGFAIAACTWLAWTAGAPLLLALSPTVIYLADTGWTLFRRALSGKPLLEPHREHSYQRMTDLGMSHGRVAALTAAATTCAVLAACTAMWVGSPGLTAVTSVAVAFLYLLTPALLRRRSVARGLTGQSNWARMLPMRQRQD